MHSNSPWAEQNARYPLAGSAPRDQIWNRSRAIPRRKRRNWGTVRRWPSRALLLAATLEAVRAVTRVSGVTHVALIGSLTTPKAEPKDADLLVRIADDCDLVSLAKVAHRFQRRTRDFSRWGEIFLSTRQYVYLGRICPSDLCGLETRIDCGAMNCGRCPHLHDDLRALSLPSALLAEPPVELWPEIRVNAEIPRDVQMVLLLPLIEEHRPVRRSRAA